MDRSQQLIFIAKTLFITIKIFKTIINNNPFIVQIFMSVLKMLVMLLQTRIQSYFVKN